MEQAAEYGSQTHMSIYVAGAELKRARRVMESLREAGYTVAYDWAGELLSWQCVCNDSAAAIAAAELDADLSTWRCVCKGDETEIAMAEREAIRKSDALVFLWRPGGGLESAFYEVGMALGVGLPVIVVGDHSDFFYLLPEARRVMNDGDILPVLRDQRTAVASKRNQGSAPIVAVSLC